HKRDCALARDHTGPASRRDGEEHRVHQRHVAEGIDDEREQDDGGEEIGGHDGRYDSPPPMSRIAFICLLAGGCAIAFAPILVRLSDTGPVASAFWRCALAAPLLWLMMFVPSRNSPSPLKGGGSIPLRYLVAAGLF